MHKSNHLVSVIVPVYNVEGYLEKCILSLMEQSYSNLEVILVDDGSSDRSLSICNGFARQDKRLKVYSKANGGLSSARNYGIERANGQYIIFVDSDDHIASDMIEYLVTFLREDLNVDIVTCNFVKFYEGEPTPELRNAARYEAKVSSCDALEMALYSHKTTLHACFKLYRASLFHTIRFPEGRLYEDAGTVYKVFDNANSIVVTDAEKYFYLQRRNSITRSEFNLAKLDLLDFSEDIHEFISDKHPSIVKAADYYLFSNAAWIGDAISAASREKYADAFGRCISLMKGRAPSVLCSRRAKLITRIYAGAFLFGKRALLLAYSIKRFAVQRRSI